MSWKWDRFKRELCNLKEKCSFCVSWRRKLGICVSNLSVAVWYFSFVVWQCPEEARAPVAGAISCTDLSTLLCLDLPFNHTYTCSMLRYQRVHPFGTQVTVAVVISALMDSELSAVRLIFLGYFIPVQSKKKNIDEYQYLICFFSHKLTIWYWCTCRC